MKKSNLFIATLLVVAAITIAMVSCKKDNQDVLLNTPQSVNAFTPPVVDDMNAYLKDFKQKMKESQNSKDTECLSLEEAAWHLASVANYDFANANVIFDDIRFDTIYSNVTITSDSVLLKDLATAYENISFSIDKFYQSLPLDEKHFRFINASITCDGSVFISLTTTFIRSSRYLDDTIWGYPNWWELMSDCHSFFNGSPLPAATLGRSELERFLNWKENRLIHPEFPYYYTPTFDTTFYYRNEIDPFGSPSYMNSRLFANITSFNVDISGSICYYIDSYRGIAHENCPSDQYVVSWNVIYDKEVPGNEHHWKEHHMLKVQYGTRHEHIGEPNPGHGGR